MLKAKYLFLILIITSIHAIAFPNIIWVLLQDPDNLNALQLLSLNNIHHFSQQSKHQMRVITTLNYTEYVDATHELTPILSHNFLDGAVMRRAIIQLIILEKYGGIWIDLPAIMTEPLSWLETVTNQRHINNRIIQPKNILFYSPEWMEETYERTDLKVQSLAVNPNLHSWFVATVPESQFIKDWRKLIIGIAGKTQSELGNFYNTYGLNPQEYLLDSSHFLEWTSQATIKIMQKQLDKQYGTTPRKLAINHYELSSINTAETAYLLSAEAKGHTHLTTKLFTELPISHLGLKFAYLLMPYPKVAEEMAAIIDPELPMSEHMHSSVSLLCQNEEIPYRHVITDSVTDRFLFKLDPRETKKTYSPQYIKQHCSTTYQSVFYELLTSYILPALAVFFHLYIVRRMILIFRPEWGVRRKRMP